MPGFWLEDVFPDLDFGLYLSYFKALGEATEVRVKLETFMGYRLIALELMAKVIQ
uniref:Uncharacterized protein n=1 Tax=Rhizophagus irregularis (strain DAOM 181602 / DAOM 197198 / MUCL 43194) TaxID=747089 RepID=U9UZF3_RHIID